MDKYAPMPASIEIINIFPIALIGIKYLSFLDGVRDAIIHSIMKILSTWQTSETTTIHIGDDMKWTQIHSPITIINAISMCTFAYSLVFPTANKIGANGTT